MDSITEGGLPPPDMEAAEGRLNEVRWECGKRKKNICKYLSNIRAHGYLVDFFKYFPYVFPRAFSTSEIQKSVGVYFAAHYVYPLGMCVKEYRNKIIIMIFRRSANKQTGEYN